jgi:hypothetical protein
MTTDKFLFKLIILKHTYKYFLKFSKKDSLMNAQFLRLFKEVSGLCFKNKIYLDLVKKSYSFKLMTMMKRDQQDLVKSITLEANKTALEKLQDKMIKNFELGHIE